MKTERFNIQEEITDRVLLEKLENILGAEETYGGTIERIKNIKIVQKISWSKSCVNCEFLVEFDALINGDFWNYDRFVDRKWIRFNGFTEGLKYYSVYDKEEDYVGVESPMTCIFDMVSYDICKAIIDYLECRLNYDIIYSGVEESYDKYIRA